MNAVAPTSTGYDGFLVHSRASAAASLRLGRRVNGLSTDELAPPEVGTPDPTYVRTDLDVPVLVVFAETDLVGEHLGYARARQPDSPTFRSWEVAGTADGDAYQLGLGDADDGSGAADARLFAALSDPPSSVYFGVITCASPINAGPQTYVLRAALHALDRWVRTGEPPSSMPRLELDDAGTAFRLDDLGNVVGGIRTPQVDVPIAALSGLGQDGDSFCRAVRHDRAVRGTTSCRLVATATTPRLRRRVWQAATDAAVAAGVILPADAEHLSGSPPVPPSALTRPRPPVSCQPHPGGRRRSRRQHAVASAGYLSRQARSKGRRQACGAISWWMALGPHEPGA